MFKWKIYSYSNLNWKEETIEKEFDNIEEYNTFVNSNNSFWVFNSFLSSDLFSRKKIFFDELFLDSYKLMKWLWNKQIEKENNNKINGIDINKYEEELNKIENEKKEKETKKQMLDDTILKLNEYLEKFKKEKREEIVKKIEEDIEKTEKELKDLKNNL